MIDVDAAYVKLKEVTARAMVERDKAAEALAKAEREAGQLDDALNAAVDADDDARAEAIIIQKQHLDEMVALNTQLRDAKEAHYQEMLGELKDFKGSIKDLERSTLNAQVSELTTPDPFAPSVTDRALENVRDEISSLEAQVEVNKVVAGASLEKDFRKLSRDAQEASARAQLEALKAARKAKQTGAASDGDETAPKKPKKTL